MSALRKLGNHANLHSQLSAGGLLIALGIIYGDIGTSPLYVMKAIMGEKPISERLVLGGLSLVFWTLTLQTTIKYVWLTLRADNNGEGGIFSLFALVRRRYPLLIFPAMIGGATLLADGMITPPISVSSAIEGLRIIYPSIDTLPIVIGIITVLFIVQQFGTGIVGRFFGPLMSVWFTTLAVLGIANLMENPTIVKAISPHYAWDILWNEPAGFWVLGAVFLCTTGAEALYSDLGHCGRRQIRISWIFVKTTLLLNYFGQGAWLISHQGELLQGRNPFYQMMPEWFLIPGIVIASLAAVIASQALISGSFTLISEAIRLDIWPKFRVVYPTIQKGQLYVPTVNGILWAGCVAVVLYFRDSERMEGAYGLAITLTMLMTTVLLLMWLHLRKWPMPLIVLLGVVYLSIEFSFLASQIVKVVHGGWVTLVVSGVLFLVMWISYEARKIKNRLTDFEPFAKYQVPLKALSNDASVAKYATHLVYLTASKNPEEIESKVIYSIFKKQPKRADVYWFIHVQVVDDPFTMEYKVDIIDRNDVYWIEFRLGFRVEQRINLLFRLVVEELVRNGEVDIISRYTSLFSMNFTGDFRFVVLQKYLSVENDLSAWDNLVMKFHFMLKRISLSEEKAFGLDTSNVTVEKVPLIIEPVSDMRLTRVY
jgi:KUP system potassium uptake protein